MNWQELSDRELVQLCLQDEQHEGWREFLRRFQPLIAAVVAKTVRRIKFGVLSDRSLVDDLVEETLLKLWNNQCRAMRTFQWLHEHSFRGFLKVTSSNVVKDHFRKNRPVEEALEEDESNVPIVPPAPGVEKEALVEKLVACLQKLLSAETDRDRNLAIFLLYYRYGLTAKEISRLYPLTIKAVENTLLRLGRIAKTRCISK
jgi:RNA polymerase sigma factor (sigma-70 family)